MKILRTVSTRRLLAMMAGLVAAAAAGTAIAVAAAGTGPVPPPKSLAKAIHQALGAGKVTGITARISFSNHLIDASNLQGSDPILTGATGRLWFSSDHRFRLELQSDNGDAQVVVDHGSFWVYDPSSRTVYEGKLPADLGKTADAGKAGQAGTRADKSSQDQLPSLARIQSEIARVSKHVNLSGAIPGDVAGQAAYTIRISPKHDGGLLGAGALAWDAVRGVPLRIGIYAQHDSTPVLELKATDVSFGPVPASVFNISPPTGSKVVKVSTAAGHHAAMAADRRIGKLRRRRHMDVSGPAAVARQLPFKLLAPAKLVGLPRRSVTLLDWAGSPAALVSYGQNLGGVVVIEQTPSKSAATASSSSSGDRHGGLSLPTVSINGATGQELDTALGSMVRFTRADVTYTVLGSVPAAAADAAARAL